MSTKNEVAAILYSGMVRLGKKVATIDRDRDVSPARLSILAVLAFGGSQTIGSLSRIEGVKPPTMTNLINALEKEELVKRSRVGSDGRQSQVAITAKGRKHLEKARERRLKQLVNFLEPLNKQELGALESASKVLLKLSRSFDDH